MKRILLVLLGLLLFRIFSFSQTVQADVVTLNPNDKFTYDSQDMPHYGLKWPVDSWNTGGNSAWLSGYAGIKMFTWGQPRLVINSSGNVGVNTSTPNYKMDINGSINASGQAWFSYNSNIAGYSWTNAALTTNSIEIVNNNEMVSTSSPTLAFHRYGSGGPQFRLAADGTNVLYLESAGANSAGNINPYGGGPNSYFSKLHIDGSVYVEKNIGIGIVSPSDKLEVAGNISSQRIKTGNATWYNNSRNSFNSFNSGNDNALNIGWISADFGGSDNLSNRIVMGVGYNGKAVIATHNFNLTDWGGPLLLNPYGGNIGIGTLNPTQKLSVGGTILAKKVKVSQSASDWPDYVFDSSYQLPSLDSVSTFIQANKHLPDIPSAATVEKDGHDLGEVQKQLLKKVEELTLYVIQLKAENETMKKEITELKQKQ